MTQVLRKEVFARNVTDRPQKIVHRALMQMAVIPVMPGGYCEVRGDTAVIEPGQAFRVPMVVWHTGTSLYRAPWNKEISKEEFLANGADAPPVDPVPGEPCPLCGQIVLDPDNPTVSAAEHLLVRLSGVLEIEPDVIANMPTDEFLIRIGEKIGGVDVGDQQTAAEATDQTEQVATDDGQADTKVEDLQPDADAEEQAVDSGEQLKPTVGGQSLTREALQGMTMPGLWKLQRELGIDEAIKAKVPLIDAILAKRAKELA